MVSSKQLLMYTTVLRKVCHGSIKTAHPGCSPDNSSSRPFSRQQLLQAVLQTTAPPGCSPDNSSSRPFSRQQLIQAVLQTTAHPGCSPNNSSRLFLQTTADLGCCPETTAVEDITQCLPYGCCVDSSHTLAPVQSQQLVPVEVILNVVTMEEVGSTGDVALR